MTIKLNHTIVPAHDKEASARFFAQIFGFIYEGPMGHFAPVRVNEDLTLDFDNAESFESHHYAFYVSDDDFDSLFVIVPSPVRVRVVWPVAGAQKPPCPFEVACVHRIVNVDVNVPPAIPVSVPLDVSVQPAVVN